MGGAFQKGVHLVSELRSEIASHDQSTWKGCISEFLELGWINADQNTIMECVHA